MDHVRIYNMGDTRKKHLTLMAVFVVGGVESSVWLAVCQRVVTVGGRF